MQVIPAATQTNPKHCLTYRPHLHSTSSGLSFIALHPVMSQIHSHLTIVPLQMQGETGSPTIQASPQTDIDRPTQDAIDSYQGNKSTCGKQQTACAWLNSLQGIWDSGIQMGICLISGGFGRNPAEGLSNPPNMRIHRKFMPIKAEHEHTCNGLLANSLESFQLSLDLFICALPQML